jgi:geranylgeranylglycerol-phosphate geranylgeranyltransferase
VRIARAVVTLTRLDSCLLVFLAVFVPVLARSGNLSLSFGQAIPLLFIAMCTYIANDLDDLERDRVNHPSRPLPSSELSPTFAATLYFISLALALLTIKLNIEGTAAFAFYGLLTISISYVYIVDWLPVLKSSYVAGAIAIPIVIVAIFYPAEPRLRVLAAAVFLINWGRELCKDIVDRPGDKVSFMHRLPARRVAIFAFALQGAALAFLITEIVVPHELAVMLLMVAIFIHSYRLWFRLGGEQKAIVLMKVQLFVGLYFLL